MTRRYDLAQLGTYDRYKLANPWDDNPEPEEREELDPGGDAAELEPNVFVRGRGPARKLRMLQLRELRR